MIAMLPSKKSLKNNPISSANLFTGTLNGGFTLLEVIIALAIMVMAFGSILAVEMGSINASARAKQMNIVAMLAKNKMIDTEFKFQGKTFSEVKKEEEGVFEDPYQDYRWKAVIKELHFPNIGGAASQNGSQDQMGAMLVKTVSNFLSKAIREVDVTVIWKKSSAEQTFTLSTYWVDLNYELQIQQ